MYFHKISKIKKKKKKILPFLKDKLRKFGEFTSEPLLIIEKNISEFSLKSKAAVAKDIFNEILKKNDA